jgi:hypothetical protein
LYYNLGKKISQTKNDISNKKENDIKSWKNVEILDRSIAFFYDMIYQINTAIQEQDLI